MKKFLTAVVIVVSTMTLAQQTDKCDLPKDYQEPKPEKRLQSSLKRVNATINDLRKHIAVENDCDEKDVVFLRISEQLGNGMYSVCVAGKPMKYKRMGSVFMGANENPFDTVSK
ncbi:hypothetical protein ATE47_00475 [Chryseobacterium sp. IHB B 17019]|uniref:hypothetical protein n=1 Tax=Chryseobacterium sp. IHB B 17019 TaxID=1721091 RepID=UPI0007228633|nr:hypothetical protein [Chryseobacterium sp. IHB B 17019]ALR29112.1 hypothetical protein ATE47_00475 [Chryseobacterium sp. IHB B 17019]